MTTPFPTGTVTFLFVEIPDGSSLRAQAPQFRADVLDRFRTLLEKRISAHDGAIFERRAQGAGAAFASTRAALQAAFTARRALDDEAWEAFNQLGVRMALHTGVVDLDDGVYVGRAVNRGRLLLEAGHEGQILLSQVTEELVRDQLPDGITLRDLGAYHLGDASRSEHLFQLVTEDVTSGFPPLQPPARRPGNLPVPATPLIGRERDVAAVVSTLRRADVRLLTVSGPGGVGKTRLALEAAARLQSTFADGVFFVDLGSLRNADLVLPTIAHTLGVRSSIRGSPLTHLSDYLADKHQLLLLDSFEHVLSAVAALGSLLTFAPQLKLLVTSRAVLHLTAEHEFPVSPLAVPDHGERYSSSETIAHGAVALFIQRARAVRPDFTMTGETISSVVEICRRLDGLPLAVELAAARSKLFPPPVLLKQFESRLSLLTGGPQDLPARQRTLRDTLDWSYELLDSELQTLFRQLAVFEGGFTLEAAEAVCNAGRHWPGGILDGLAALADQSLLRRPEHGVDAPRFTMLDTIHEYASDLLEQSGETTALRQRHAAFFLQLSEAVEPKMWGSDMRTLLDRLEAEHANLRAALSWSLAQDEAETAARLVSALVVFWDVRHRHEGRYWLEAALAGEGSLPSALRAKALHAAGVLARALYDLEEANVCLQASLALYRELGSERGLAASVTDLGAMLATLGGERQRAKSLLEDGLQRYRALENEPGISWALYGLGWVELRRVLGDRQGSPWALAELDTVARSPEDLEAARDLFAESLRLRRSVGEPYHVAWALASLALVAAAQSDYDTARTLTEERLEIERALGNPYGVAASLQQLGVIALRQGEPAAGRAFLVEGLAVAQERGDQIVTALLLMGLGEVKHAQGELPAATTSFDEALKQFRVLGDRHRMARVQAWLAQLALAREDATTACTLASQCLALAREVGAPETITACLAGLADSAARRGSARWAVQLWAAAERYDETANASRTPARPANRPHLVQSIQAELGEGAFAAAWSAGRALSPEEVLAALEEARPLRVIEGVLPDSPGGRSPPSPPAGLTPRQYEVLLLVAEGLSNAQIAERLAISTATVKAHLTAIYRKLGVSRRTAAIRYMIDHGYL